jgi:hypothetical protein
MAAMNSFRLVSRNIPFFPKVLFPARDAICAAQREQLSDYG